MTRALLKQALAAIDGLEVNYGNLLQSSKTPEELYEISTAIRAYLAQPQGEPVAWMHSKTGRVSESPYDLSLADDDETAIPLYESPPLSEAEIQDLRDRAVGMLEKPFPAPQTQQERKPMPEQEMNDLAFQCGIQREDARDPGVEEFARAVEAFHGIKEKP